MNDNKLDGAWEDLKWQVRERWGKFTNNDLSIINGRKDHLLKKLQEKYSYTAAEAKNEVDLFVKSCCNVSKKSNVQSSRP